MIRLLPTKPFGKNASSQPKVGPKNAILGLCEEELIKGYLRGNIQTDASEFIPSVERLGLLGFGAIAMRKMYNR